MYQLGFWKLKIPVFVLKFSFQIRQFIVLSVWLFIFVDVIQLHQPRLGTF
jgi:hypothetical protein